MELNIFKLTINGQQYDWQSKEITGSEIRRIANIENDSTLFYKVEGIDEQIHDHETVDLGRIGIEHFYSKPNHPKFKFTFNGVEFVWNEQYITSTQLYEIGHVNRDDHIFLKEEGGDKEIKNDERIDLAPLGIEHFYSKENCLEVVEVEQFGKECKQVPCAKIYKVRIDKQIKDFDTPEATGKEILAKVSLTPSTHDIFKIMHGNPKPQKIKPDDLVSFRECCLERFVTLPKEQKDGRGSRREFNLPADEIDFLNNQGLPWETLINGSNWLMIHDYPIPEGYNVDKVDVALLIPSSYNATEIDMVYFYPCLQKKTGAPINATTSQLIDGRNFQCWSRHRNTGEWRPGVDNIMTHLLLVDNWLFNDLKR